MDDQSPAPRPPTRRRPLGDGVQRANTLTRSPSPSRSKRTASSPGGYGIPHHESLDPTGPLTVRNVASSPKDKRLSAVTDEESESKRNSQVSTASSAKGRRRKTHIGPWELGNDIGKGGLGRVRKVRHCVTGQHAAVKIIKKQLAQAARAESLVNLEKSSKTNSLAAFAHVMPYGIEREVIIMKLLEHPNIVKLYDVWENRSELYLIMEYVDGGELFDHIQNREVGWLEEDETVWLFRQMVAALYYCHRLGIHHRDLKPENILLDKTTLSVKLADFGMAALQPKGSHLTTPCGSVHYAAPEVFHRKYDGSKIDVWSLGVILFVMLVGYTPFPYDQKLYEENTKEWFRILQKGEFHMPEELSIEAQDLISKMLQPNPARRISLLGVWQHPFVHKYVKQWGEPDSKRDLSTWLGVEPVIKAYNVKERRDIDREILRNLRTLWHSVNEEILISKLLSPEPNHEKYFYYALKKHRDEQLENYSVVPESLTYSTSDYHHLRKPPPTLNVPPVPTSRPVTRTKSQFSIYNDEHLQSGSSILEAPTSERSYDPYRASSSHLKVGGNGHPSIVVNDSSSRHSRKGSGTQTLRHPASLRVEALKKGQQRISTASSSASLRPPSTSARSRVSGSRRSISRSSFASSTMRSSPSISTKPSAKHKRGVDFSHLRQSSTASALEATRNTTEPVTTPKKHVTKAKHLTPDIRDPLSSPQLYANNRVISKKEANALSKPSSGSRHASTHSEVIDIEARKVSVELEKYCEEIFNRSSTGSSRHKSSATMSLATSTTPPSSVSARGSSQSAHGVGTPSSSKRPLPEPPTETPTTYATRELAETRDRLAARYAADPGANNQTYAEVLAHLNALLKQPATFAETSKRAISLPEQKFSAFLLPAISEEGDKPGSIDAADSIAGAAERHKDGKQDLSTTVRLVEPSSPRRPAPLNIRKISSSTTGTLSDGTTIRGRYQQDASRPRLGRITTPTSPVRLNMFQHQGDYDAPTSSYPVGPTVPRKWAWWKRIRARGVSAPDPKIARSDSERSVASAGRDYKAKRTSDPSNKGTSMSGALPGTDSSPTSPVLPGKRPGFLKFFTRTTKSKANADQNSGYDATQEVPTPDTKTTFSSSDRSYQTLGHTHKERVIEDNDRAESHDLGVQQNWLARFLHIKPATRVLCLQATRGRARTELVRVLENWRVHGIRDVIMVKQRNLVFARLDAVNALGLKEVEFVVELFIVLEKGRRKGLSIARFMQRKGAASSFRRVVQEVEARLENKRMLVRDKGMRKEMEALLAEGMV